MKRHEYLIISAVCLIGFILTLAAIARAETIVSLEVIGQGAGYDTGYGVAVSHTTGRYANIFAFHGEANIANCKKYNASEGYTYGASGQVRAYYGDAYLGAGYGVFKRVKVLAEISRMEYWQDGNRDNDIVATFGIGCQF